MRAAWAPQRFLGVTGLAALAGYVLAALLLLHTPWLGLTLAPDAHAGGLRVMSVAAGSPNRSRIEVGTRLRSAGGAHGDAVPLGADTLLQEPDVLSFARLHSFYARQSALAADLRDGELTAKTSDGTILHLVARPRPLTAISPIFLLHAGYGLAGLLICVGIWVFRPRQRPTQLLAISGVGFYLCNLGPAVYASRELALNGRLFALLSGINHFGTILFTVALVALMWAFPRPLTQRVPAVPALFALAGGFWLADLLHVGPSAAYTIYLPLTLLFLLSLVFTVAQWRASRTRPAERAAMRWIILAMLWATLATILLVMIPGIKGRPLLLPEHLVFGGLLLMYFGIAAAVLRFRLFELETWWLRTWLWVAGGVAIVALDTLLVVIAGMGHSQSLVLSLLLVGFAWFPLRQWLLQRLLPGGYAALDQVLPRLTADLIGVHSASELGQRWSELMLEAFHPLNHALEPGKLARAQVRPDGISMAIPHPQGEHTLVLRYAGDGSRLFNRRDLRLAQAFTDVGRYAVQALNARAAGATEERERIMGDLHDDLGAKLLTVVHAARDEQDQALARSALADLRALVATRELRPATLTQLLTAWRAEFERRVRLAGVEPVWRVAGAIPDLELPGRAVADIARIRREAVSNAIKHAAARRIECTLTVADNALTMTVSDDGVGGDPTQWHGGHGLYGMHRRAGKIGASLTLEPGCGGTRVILRYPLQASPASTTRLVSND